MGISIFLRGEGDMKKSEYDSDKNLKIDGAMYKEDYDADEDGRIDNAVYKDEDTPKKYAIIPSDDLICKDETQEQSTSQQYIKIKEIQLSIGEDIGYVKLRIKFKIMSQYSEHVYGRIYRNGSPVGPEHSTTSMNWVMFTDEIDGWSNGDYVQLYIKNEVGSYTYTNLLEVDGKLGFVDKDVSFSGTVTG